MDIHVSQKTVVDDLLERRLAERAQWNEISRELFLFGFPEVFKGKEGTGFAIINSISQFFKVPFSNIAIVGSAKFGYSYIKKTVFKPGMSDLDIAVVNPELFRKYTELVHKKTNNYSRCMAFAEQTHPDILRQYILKGVFRPDLMPRCKEKTEWHDFFDQLSEKHTEIFKKITATLYFSEYFFESKQKSLIHNFKKEKGCFL